MSKLIIVEGLDRCGKSTIIERIRNKFPDDSNFLVVHSSKPEGEWTKESQLEHYKTLLQKSFETIDEDITVIHDRSYFGEFVYGQIHRNVNYNMYDFIEFEKNIPDALLDRVTLLIMTDGNTESRLSRDDNQSITNDTNKMEQEYSEFFQHYLMTKIPNKLFVDWSTVEFTEETLDKILTELQIVT